jgi:hypothetical protein
MAHSELVNQSPIELPTVAAPTSPTRKALRRFRRHRLAMFGVVTIVVLVVAWWRRCSAMSRRRLPRI